MHFWLVLFNTASNMMMIMMSGTLNPFSARVPRVDDVAPTFYSLFLPTTVAAGPHSLLPPTAKLPVTCNLATTQWPARASRYFSLHWFRAPSNQSIFHSYDHKGRRSRVGPGHSPQNVSQTPLFSSLGASFMRSTNDMTGQAPTFFVWNQPGIRLRYHTGIKERSHV